jgi:hypothetical protein
MGKSTDEEKGSPSTSKNVSESAPIELEKMEKSVPIKGLDASKPLFVSNDRETLYTSGTASCKWFMNKD